MTEGEIDCSFTEELVCPYCGHEQGDSWELKDGECQCSRCEKHFIFESEAIRYFTSRQVPCLNGEPHTWGAAVIYDPRYPDARRCTDCRTWDWGAARAKGSDDV